MKLKAISLHVLAWLIALFAFTHLVASMLAIITQASSWVEAIANVFVRCAEVFTLSCASLIALQLADYFRSPGLELAEIPENLLDLAVLIPVRSAPASIVERSLSAFSEQVYPGNYQLTLCVDGTDADLVSQYREIAFRYGAEISERDVSTGFKAGAVNFAFRRCQAPLLSVFDVDQIPRPGILAKLAASLEKCEPEVAYVQAKAAFPNTVTWASRWVAMAYSQVFEIFLKSLDRRRITLFHGTTAMFRSELLKEVGGFDEQYFTEDTATSVKLFLNGYQGRFLNVYGSDGSAPELIREQWAQMFRWTHGATHLMRNKGASIALSRLSVMQKMILLFTVGVFVVSTSVFVIALLHLLMAIFAIPVLSLGAWGNIMFIAIPVIMTVIYNASVMLALWSLNRSSDEAKFSIWDMMLAYTYAFSLNGFLTLPVITGMLGIRKPDASKMRWNPKFNQLGMAFLMFAIAAGFAVPAWLIGVSFSLLYFEFLMAAMFAAAGVAALYDLIQPHRH